MNENKELELEIKKYTLENAVKYKGKANSKFVLGQLLSSNKEYRSKAKEITPFINKIVDEINSLELNKQEKLLKEINPSFFEKNNVIKEERNIFDFLNIKENQQVISAFPPSPEKHYHIGHAKAILLNYLLAKKYNGKFYLRFEDTNPGNLKPEYYKVMQDDISWLGVKWDKVQYACDHMDLFIDFAELLIKKGQAYVCFCDSKEISEKRKYGINCNCRNSSIQENLKHWYDMKKDLPEGSALLRLKIDMKHKNYRMRDPGIFRILDKEHSRLGYKYRIYPMYDFQNAIMDGYFNITHRLRTIEFEMAAELHHYIRKILNLYDTITYEFSRFNLEGMLSSGRIIREKVENGDLIGWDDPSLPTLAALRRRGFSAQAIKDLVVESGITKSAGTTLTWDTLYKYNRKVLNNNSKRFFCIIAPIEIEVEDDPKRNYILNMHPSLNLGIRNFQSNGVYYLEKEDVNNLKNNMLVRLMDNINLIINKESDNNLKYKFNSIDYLDFKNYKLEKKIIHFLPKDNNQLVNITILKPDHKILKAKAEKNIEILKVGDIIQFERFAFCRLDSISEDENKSKIYNFWYTHK
jgi:glutamyl-tRNA synthetase